MKIHLLAFAICLGAFPFMTRRAAASPGDLDPSFGSAGKLTIAVTESDDYCSTIALQSDGKSLLAGTFLIDGHFDFVLIRLLPNGLIDTTFGTAGKVIIPKGASDDQGYSVSIQTDDKILLSGRTLVSGTMDYALFRFNADGARDLTFGNSGKVTTDFGTGDDIGGPVVVQPDGRIVVAGIVGLLPNGRGSAIGVARYNANGTLDSTFGSGGKVSVPPGTPSGIALQADGKIVVAGSVWNGVNEDFMVFRLLNNGASDTGFGMNGRTSTALGSQGDIGQKVGIQSNGRIIVAGWTDSGTGSMPNLDIGIVCYASNGILDGSFGAGGKIITSIGAAWDEGWGLDIQQNNKVVVVGSYWSGTRNEFALVRYNFNGSLDSSFGVGGKVTTGVGRGDAGARSVVRQTDGKFLAAGSTWSGFDNDFAIVRYEGDPADSDGDGVLDIYETGTGIYVSPQNTGTSPNVIDTDGDGLSDGAEVNLHSSNPNVSDTDGDGFSDGFEVARGFSPISPTSTPDGISTALQAIEYRFNAASGVSYRIEASTDLVSWNTVETPIIGNGGVIVRFYSIEGQPKRFFRSRRN